MNRILIILLLVYSIVCCCMQNKNSEAGKIKFIHNKFELNKEIFGSRKYLLKCFPNMKIFGQYICNFRFNSNIEKLNLLNDTMISVLISDSSLVNIQAMSYQSIDSAVLFEKQINSIAIKFMNLRFDSLINYCSIPRDFTINYVHRIENMIIIIGGYKFYAPENIELSILEDKNYLKDVKIIYNYIKNKYHQ